MEALPVTAKTIGPLWLRTVECGALLHTNTYVCLYIARSTKIDQSWNCGHEISFLSPIVGVAAPELLQQGASLHHRPFSLLYVLQRVVCTSMYHPRHSPTHWLIYSCMHPCFSWMLGEDVLFVLHSQGPWTTKSQRQKCARPSRRRANMRPREHESTKLSRFATQYIVGCIS